MKFEALRSNLRDINELMGEKSVTMEAFEIVREDIVRV